MGKNLGWRSRRPGRLSPGSLISSSDDGAEFTLSDPDLQLAAAAWLARRYGLPVPLARVIAAAAGLGGGA